MCVCVCMLTFLMQHTHRARKHYTNKLHTQQQQAKNTAANSREQGFGAPLPAKSKEELLHFEKGVHVRGLYLKCGAVLLHISLCLTRKVTYLFEIWRILKKCINSQAKKWTLGPSVARFYYYYLTAVDCGVVCLFGGACRV